MAEMRVMLDTNVLLSAMLFPGTQTNRMMQSIFEEHRLVLSSFVVEELTYVVKRKFPEKLQAVDRLLASMSFELAYTPQGIEQHFRGCFYGSQFIEKKDRSAKSNEDQQAGFLIPFLRAVLAIHQGFSE